MEVGFTGTQAGMTIAQQGAVIGLLTREQATIVHHGGCVGADIDFDVICVNFLPPIRRIIHPSDRKNKQGDWVPGAEVRPELPPLIRNCDIVNETDLLIATSRTDFEELRSGTWMTIRYARRLRRHICIVWPNGEVKEEFQPAHGIDFTGKISYNNN